MDQRERSGDFTEALRAALDARQAKLWTALPGIIQSFDPVAQTAVVQPAIQARQSFPDGSVKLVDLPLLLDCPVQFPRGGGVSLTFPVQPDDECLVVLASRCIDAWWQSGGVQAPMEARMHDLSDGFVLLGFWSQPRVLAGLSTAAAVLRSDDGLTTVTLDPTAQTVEVAAPKTIKLRSHDSSTSLALDPVAQTIALVAPGGVFLNGIKWDTHEHGGVQAGGAKTGGPTSP